MSDLGGHQALKLKGILEGASVTLGAQCGLVFQVDKGDIYSNLAHLSLSCSFENISDVQLFAQPFGSLWRLFVCHHRRPADHAQPLWREASQGGDGLDRDSVVERLL